MKKYSEEEINVIYDTVSHFCESSGHSICVTKRQGELMRKLFPKLKYKISNEFKDRPIEVSYKKGAISNDMKLVYYKKDREDVLDMYYELIEAIRQLNSLC